MAAGDIGKFDQGIDQGTGMVPYQDPGYPAAGYGYDAWAGRPTSNWNAAMMDTLFKCQLPKENDDFENYLELIRCVIDILPRIPNYNAEMYNEINRDFEDIIDRAHSEGRERVTASKMCKMIIKLRSIVPRGDFPLAGITGVSAIISSRIQSEQTVKMPQPERQSSGGVFGVLNPLNWGRR